MKFKKAPSLLIPLLLCLSSAASSLAIGVKTDFDRYKTSAGRTSKHGIHCGMKGLRQT